MAYNDFRMPEPRIYSHLDLYPGQWDSRCSPQFPLANFWPVYVGNFWCDVYLEHATKVQEYFASKGLLVRMVFGRSATDDPHFDYQRIFHLYDFLVYFVRPQDADDAISYCHREMYYGHRLNVFPGRVPLYFDSTKSVKHTIQQPLKLQMTEQVYETYIQRQCPAQVTCVVQHHRMSLIAEYVSVKDRDKAIKYCRVCLPKAIDASQQKQRFIEQDVQHEICDRFQKDPSFANMLPPDIILSAFFSGVRFNCYRWRFFSRLRMPQQMYLIGQRSYRLRLHKRAFKSALKHFGVKCTCKPHVRMYFKQQKCTDESNAQPTIKVAEPLSGDNLRNEVAVRNATNGSNILPSVVAVQAPAVNLRVQFAGDSFYDDSYDIDFNLGIAF
ncbi:uncharacterized protein LOC135698131 isoform X1 [Ochlerotatus camptorhynchus]|uniref:uncharacterized protein LOC135698131 isoform X1 n=1 Tax=Ochlerotatus camptorhynchus TaxID=644619 RepID=UPI0031D662D2